MRAPAKTFVRARRLRREMTLPEVQLWQALRGSAMNGTRFRRQHPIGIYVLDFYAPSAKLAIEVDGAAHDIPCVARRDVARDAWLSAQGLRIMRFSAVDILSATRRDDVVATIAAALTDPY